MEQVKEVEELKGICKVQGIPLYLAEGADHSLETGKTEKDIRILGEIVQQAADFFAGRR